VTAYAPALIDALRTFFLSSSLNYVDHPMGEFEVLLFDRMSFYASSLIENLIDEAVWLFVIVTLIGFFFLVFSEANLIPVLVISYNGGL